LCDAIFEQNHVAGVWTSVREVGHLSVQLGHVRRQIDDLIRPTLFRQWLGLILAGFE
jgi:hypothetical protein